MKSRSIKEATSDKPLLSIIIPTYRRSEYVVDAITSALNQKNAYLVPYEIVVVNNDPDANMGNLIEMFNQYDNISFYINSDNYGQVGNVNQGIILSRGKFVALLHDDDILLPNYLDSIHDFLEFPVFDCLVIPNYTLEKKYVFDLKHKLLSLFFFARYLFRKKYNRITLIKNAKSLRNTYGVPTCGMIFSKEKLENFGLFKDISGAAWDYRNFRLFNKSFSIGIINKYLAVRRLYTGMSNLERIQQEFYEEKMEMIRENGDVWIVRHFGESFIKKKPFYKYIIAFLFSNFYFYFHNLDTTKAIPKSLFNNLIIKKYHI